VLLVLLLLLPPSFGSSLMRQLRSLLQGCS
jgi:hypothetical protein